MSGTVWMFSDQIDDEDIDFMHREFVTYNMASNYYGLGMKPVIRHYDFQVLKEQTAYIGRIAGSINQIAKRCNENKSVHTNDVEQLRREFLELKADYLERVVKLLRKLY